MKKLINSSIIRWKSQRNKKMLLSPYKCKYAFVGVGSHALQNLYPVLRYLGIQLKYICCTSPDKLDLIESRFDVKATTSLDIILDDDEVKGVFVCASPQHHYEICSRVISSGKYLFIEKPPCYTQKQLENLIEADIKQKVLVGMQKRYSPFIKKLEGQLSKEEIISYTLTYHTGAYPEGNPFTDLFIHPVDLVTHLFGETKIVSMQQSDQNGMVTVYCLLSHGKVKGFLELSTAYSWANSEELLRVNTLSGEYRLSQMERLTFYPHPKKIIGIPIEKLGLFSSSEQVLVERNNFNPLVENNQLFTQGFYSEIKAFADMVELSGKNHSPLSSLKGTYEILSSIGTKK